MFLKGLNKVKMLFHAKATPADSTTLLDSIKSHRKQPYLLFSPIPYFYSGQKCYIVCCSRKKKWKTQPFKMKTSYGNLDEFLTVLSFPFLKWDSNRCSAACCKHKNIYSSHVMGFPGSPAGKESTRNVGDLGSIPGLRRSPGGVHGNPHQYSYLENSMDRAAWRATVHGVAKSRTGLSGHAQHSTVMLYLR